VGFRVWAHRAHIASGAKWTFVADYAPTRPVVGGVVTRPETGGLHAGRATHWKEAKPGQRGLKGDSVPATNGDNLDFLLEVLGLEDTDASNAGEAMVGVESVVKGGTVAVEVGSLEFPQNITSTNSELTAASGDGVGVEGAGGAGRATVERETLQSTRGTAAEEESELIDALLRESSSVLLGFQLDPEVMLEGREDRR